jgi:hypothetical protein
MPILNILKHTLQLVQPLLPACLTATAVAAGLYRFGTASSGTAAAVATATAIAAAAASCLLLRCCRCLLALLSAWLVSQPFLVLLHGRQLELLCRCI